MTITNQSVASSTKIRIDSIEMGRGIAALAVLLLHAEGMLLPATNLHPAGFGGVFSYGFLGVDFFFALSGFIIYYTHQRDINMPSRIKNYLVRRYFRIMPAYWSVLALMLALLPFQKTWPQISANWFFSQITLIGYNIWVSQAWTLQHEFIFYGVFALSIVNKRVGLVVLYFWTTVCVLINWNSVEVTRNNALDIIFHPYNVMFVFGMITAHLYRIGGKAWLWWTIVAVLMTLGLSLNMVMTNDSLKSHTFIRYVTSAAIANLSLIVLLWYGLLQYNVPRVFVWLGKISYSVYIAHGIILMMTVGLLERMGLDKVFPRALIFACGLLGCLAVASLIQKLVEQPGIELGKRFSLQWQ